MSIFSLFLGSLLLLNTVNTSVNDSIEYKVDRAGKDIWTISPEKGDCEDYAITKRKILIERGWDPSDLQVLLLIKPTRNSKVSIGHVVLYVRSENLILDMKERSAPTPYQDYMKDWSVRCVIKDLEEGEKGYVSDRC